MGLPESSRFVIIGAGVHGLSTAYHLARALKARGRGSGLDVLIVDKTGIAAGASGIACGVIRNNYYQPAMRELMAHSVEVWESDPETYRYYPVGYMQISPEVMRGDVDQVDLGDAGPARDDQHKRRDGSVHPNVRMWSYWCLEEGTLGVDPDFQKTNDGRMPPVIHLDTDAPLFSDVDGALITDTLWGIYYKPDFFFGGVQGGNMPYKVETDPDEVKVDPYGPESPDFVAGEKFERMWCSALAFCQERFEGMQRYYKQDEPSGGLGAFTPDGFPVFDVFCENCYIIADSNHGYKTIGVGELVAEEIMGHPAALLAPFRFSRYEKGELHPVSNSPFPWS